MITESSLVSKLTKHFSSYKFNLMIMPDFYIILTTSRKSYWNVSGFKTFLNSVFAFIFQLYCTYAKLFSLFHHLIIYFHLIRLLSTFQFVEHIQSVTNAFFSFQLNLKKMKSFLILLFLAIFRYRYSSANSIVCQFYNERLKSLEQYCASPKITLPEGCSNSNQFIESYQVAKLTIEGCERNEISDAFNRFKYVNSVNIIYSRNWIVSSTLNQLQRFNASHNAMQKIPNNFFHQTPELDEIDLSHNNLGGLEWNSFDGAEKITKIHLSHNALRSVQAETILSLTRLEYIDLSFNQLNSIPEFSSNKLLKSIHLENNPIGTYDCFHITRMNKVSSYIDWRDFEFFYGNWHCEQKQLRVLRNQQFQGTFLVSRGKYELHCNDYGFKHLREFLAGRNSFENVVEVLPCLDTSLESIDLSGNSVGKLDSSTVQRFINLKELFLSDTKLRSFDLNAIVTPDRLNSLDISLNSIRRIENIQHFGRFIFLRELKMARNQLENTPEIIQHLRPSVELLDASGNSMRLLNANTFRYLTSLKILNLSDTSLAIDGPNPFEPIKNLLSLDISYNSIRKSENFVTLSATLNHLEYFYAAHCEIENPVNLFQNLRSSLVELNLSGNLIQTLNDDIFQHLENIQMLDLSYNQLQVFDVGFLSTKLERLNLEGNNLYKIEMLRRSHFTSIKSLVISRNNLPCEHLNELMREWDGITFMGDPWYQKHEKDCKANTSEETGLFRNVWNKIKFW